MLFWLFAILGIMVAGVWAYGKIGGCGCGGNSTNPKV
jgi:hypothetical protein